MDLDILRGVEKPARYIGGEVNQTQKDLRTVSTRVGLCYPDVYEIGMSHIGLKILYEVLNRRPELAAERVYAPWPDMEAVLRNRGSRLCTLENRIPLSDLHVLGFTLQYELSYSNLLNVLDLGGIPLKAADRGVDDPVVIGGGPTAFNPEPIAPFMDCICLGDGEELVLEVVDAVMASKAKRERRLDLWMRLAEIQGAYVPGLYDVHYHEDGTIAAIVPKHGAPARVRKRILMDLDRAPYFTKDLVPNMEIVHDRYGVEVQRGCMRGCRFCQAGYIYRPERQRSPETVRRLVRQGLAQTGSEEYSLLSLSLGDYNCVEPLLVSLMNEHAGSRSAITTPSMRLESLTPAIMDQIGRVRRTSFTVAPEAGSNRLRAVINKVIDEDVLIEMVSELFARGWRALKMYFMLGLPTETQDDLQAIADLGWRCRRAARRHCSSPALTISVSSFVPKSHTPFQWSPQITLDEIHDKQRFLSVALKKSKLNFRRHEPTSSVMEGVFSRGDRRTAETLVRAFQLGARMDGWQEYHDLAIWDQALAETGLSRAWINQRRRDVSEILPWSHLDCGVLEEWLWEDWMKSLEEGGVEDCSEAPCYDCGVCDHQVMHNSVFTADAPAAAPKHRAKKRYLKKSMDDVVPLVTLTRSEPAAPEPPVVEPPIPKEDRQRFRIRYAKRGLMSVTSHLESMTQLHRGLKRSGAPVLYTRGMHPRIKTSMSPPIPLGAFSEAEYLEVETRRPYDAETLRAALDEGLPEGLRVVEVEELAHEAPVIATALQAVTWALEPPPALDVEEVLARWSRGELRTIEIERKQRRRVVDLREQILALRLVGGRLELDVRVQGGARLREVFRGVVGVDPFAAPGWTVTKLAASFEPLPPSSFVPDPAAAASHLPPPVI